jgi:hypothetical protein
MVQLQIYVPSLFYYEEMGFIEGHVAARDSSSSFDDETEVIYIFFTFLSLHDTSSYSNLPPKSDS